MITPVNSIAHLADVVNPLTSRILTALAVSQKEVVITTADAPGYWLLWLQEPLQRISRVIRPFVAKEQVSAFEQSGYVSDLEEACSAVTTLDEIASGYLLNALEIFDIDPKKIGISREQHIEIEDDLNRLWEVFSADIHFASEFRDLINEFSEDGSIATLEILAETFLDTDAPDRLRHSEFDWTL